MDWFWSAVGMGGVAAVTLIAEHYATWHWRAYLRAHPPAAYTLGLGTLFVFFFLWAALQPVQPALRTVAGCLMITACGGAADWLVWRWHPWQEQREGAAQVTGLAALAEESEGRDG